MDFWSAYERKRGEEGFGASRLWLRTGERYNASLARLVDRSMEVVRGRCETGAYSQASRYLIAKDITFDLLVAFYDVNSKKVLAARPTSGLGPQEVEAFGKRLDGWGRSNIEMRLIGSQNGDKTMMEGVESMHERLGVDLVEADLFGDQARHVVMDLLTGKPYSLLLENRIYRPGELATQVKREDFDSARSELVLV